MEVQHLPVLLASTLEQLAPGRGGLFVDATVGLGGHAEALLEASPDVQLVGIDRDPQALERAGRRLARFGSRVRLAHANFHGLRLHWQASASAAGWRASWPTSASLRCSSRRPAGASASGWPGRSTCGWD